MKPRVILLFACCTLLFTSTARAEPLEIAGSWWPPYQMTENGQPAGMGTEVIREVLAGLDVPHRFSLVPWKRCVLMAERGEADAVYMISRQKDRESFLLYPETPICASTYVFFIRKEDAGRLKFDSWEDVAGHSVGVTAGYAYSEEFWKELKDRAGIQEAGTDEQNFLKLVNGRFDYFPCDVYVGAVLLKQLGLSDKVLFLKKPVVQKDYFLAFSRKSGLRDLPGLIRTFDAALKKFVQSDAYADIMAKYLP